MHVTYWTVYEYPPVIVVETYLGVVELSLDKLLHLAGVVILQRKTTNPIVPSINQ